MGLRNEIGEGIDLDSKVVVEIGPLFRPLVSKGRGRVIYVDHASTEELRIKYRDDPNFDVSEIVEVDAIWGSQTLRECLGPENRVDYVVASHVVEHVPDLISWLNELASVLNDGGEIRLIVPDKRFTFDYARRLSGFSDIMDAYMRRARRPLPHCIFDHVMNVRVVDAATAWAKVLDEADMPLRHSFEMAVGVARDALETEHYHDVHCWVFTPASFAGLMALAVEHGLLNLGCHAFEDTPDGSIEFVVYLRAADDRAAAMASWRRMEGAARRDTPGDLWRGDAGAMGAGAELAQLRAEVARLRAHEAELASSLEAERRRADAYAASSSWKITAPIRRMARLVGVR